jgi:DNA polymerase
MATDFLTPELRTLVHFYEILGIQWSLDDPTSPSIPLQISKYDTSPMLSDALSSPSPSPSVNLDQITTLVQLRQALEDFEGCALKKSATNLVFSDGNPKAQVLFVGEAPGAEEDQKGLPFVGRAGQLLDRMLASIGLDRTSVYIINTLPWRPPANRTPSPDELAACAPFVQKHIALCNPNLMVCLGGVASQALLNIKGGILRNRGQWFPYALKEGKVIPTLATFHPAYLLRQPGQKALAWKDLCALREKLQEFPLKEHKKCDTLKNV